MHTVCASSNMRVEVCGAAGNNVQLVVMYWRTVVVLCYGLVRVLLFWVPYVSCCFGYHRCDAGCCGIVCFNCCCAHAPSCYTRAAARQVCCGGGGRRPAAGAGKGVVPCVFVGGQGAALPCYHGVHMNATTCTHRVFGGAGCVAGRGGGSVVGGAAEWSGRAPASTATCAVLLPVPVWAVLCAWYPRAFALCACMPVLCGVCMLLVLLLWLAALAVGPGSCWVACPLLAVWWHMVHLSARAATRTCCCHAHRVPVGASTSMNQQDNCCLGLRRWVVVVPVWLGAPAGNAHWCPRSTVKIPRCPFGGLWSVGRLFVVSCECLESCASCHARHCGVNMLRRGSGRLEGQGPDKSGARCSLCQGVHSCVQQSTRMQGGQIT
jgi:hypothetical protein